MKQDADAPVNTKQGEGDIHWSYDEKNGTWFINPGKHIMGNAWKFGGNMACFA